MVGGVASAVVLMGRKYEKYDATVLVLHNPSGYLTKDSVGPAFT